MGFTSEIRVTIPRIDIKWPICVPLALRTDKVLDADNGLKNTELIEVKEKQKLRNRLAADQFRRKQITSCANILFTSLNQLQSLVNDNVDRFVAITHLSITVNIDWESKQQTVTSDSGKTWLIAR